MSPDEKTPAPGMPPTPRPPTDVPASPWSGTPQPPHTPPIAGGGLPELEVDDIISQKSKRVRRLGVGGQGEVWLVEHLGQLEAHKFLTQGSGTEEAVFREALHTRKVSHANIVQVYGMERVDDHHVLRMEYVRGPDLAHLVEDEGVLPVEQLVPIALQAVDALQATHERGILHHDLKPSNLILREDRRTVVVTDFGISAALRLRDGEWKGGKGGTPHYMAPELFERDGRGSPRSDIWSLGVTLYYLISLQYPFPFDRMDPADAVKEPPRDLPTSHLYVSPEFWRILRRMIETGPEDGYDSMQEVKADLDLYAHSIRCPACSNHFRTDSIHDTCPDPGCQSPRIAAYRDATRAIREAETALVECDFARAGAGFEKAEDAFRQAEATVEAEDTKRRLEGMADYEASLREMLERIEEQIERERYIDGIGTLQQARSRFSRAEPVRALRDRMAKTLRELYSETEKTVRASLAAQDFQAARDRLIRIDHILGDKYARRELARVVEEELHDFQRIYHEVEQKELVYNRYGAKGHEAILSFDFEKAVRIYSTLETEFPSDANVEMLARLRRAPNSYAYAIKYPEEILRKIIADPAILSEAKKIRLKKVNRSCARLLEDFSSEDFPTFERIERLQQLTQQAMDTVDAYVEEKLEEARQAESEQSIVDELEHLRAIEPLVMRSDLSETTTKQHVHQRLRELEDRMSKADQYYRDGVIELEACEYVKAQVAFREVESLIPDGYKDVSELLDSVQAKREKLGALRQEVSYELGEIERGNFTLESAIETLRHTGELREISAQAGRTKLDLQLINTCTALFDSQARAMRKLPDGDAQASFDFLANNFIPLIEVLPPERWSELVAQDAELCRAVCGVLSAAYEVVGTASPDLEVELRRAQRFTELMSRLDPLGPALAPPLGSTHPCEQVGNAIVESFRQSRRTQQELHLNPAVLSLRDLAANAPENVAARLREKVDELQSWGRRAAVQSWVRRGVTVARVGGPFLAALIVGLVVGILIGRSGARQGAEEEWNRLATRLGFDAKTAAQLRPLIEKDGATSEGFRFFAGWAALRDRLGRGSDQKPKSADAEVWAADLTLVGDPLVATLGKEPQRLFQDDLEEALNHALRGIFAQAAAAPSSETEGILARLRTLLPSGEVANDTASNLHAILDDGKQCMVARLEGRIRPLHIQRRAGSGGPGVQVRSLLDSIASLPTPEKVDSKTKKAAELWLRGVLLERVVDALIQRGAEAALGDLDGYFDWTAELLAACSGVTGSIALPPEGTSELETAARKALTLLLTPPDG